MDPVSKRWPTPPGDSCSTVCASTMARRCGELCERLDMVRQSATQHLDILERASLVTVVRRGRERLHYLNPAPIHEIGERWISGFDKPRLQAIIAIRTGQRSTP